MKQMSGGQWGLAIWVFPFEPQPNADMSRYVLADYDMPLDLEVNCDGVTKKPQLILKVVCRMGEFDKRKVRKSVALQKAREGSPMLW